MMKGFSLLETLSVIFLIAIIAVLALPSFNSLFIHAKSKRQGLEFLHIFKFARNEALMRNTTTILCSTENLLTCGGNWRDGYLLKTKDQLLSSARTSMRGVLYSRIFPKGTVSLQFLPLGLTNFENATFWYCEKNEVFPFWAIVLNKKGRARMVFPNQEHKILDGEGKTLKCI